MRTLNSQHVTLPIRCVFCVCLYVCTRSFQLQCLISTKGSHMPDHLSKETKCTYTAPRNCGCVSVVRRPANSYRYSGKFGFGVCCALHFHVVHIHVWSTLLQGCFAIHVCLDYTAVWSCRANCLQLHSCKSSPGSNLCVGPCTSRAAKSDTIKNKQGSRASRYISSEA